VLPMPDVPGSFVPRVMATFFGIYIYITNEETLHSNFLRELAY